MNPDPADEMLLTPMEQILVGLSIVAYMFALVLPVFPNHNPPVLGVHCLRYLFIPQWYSNPLYLIALTLTFTRYRQYGWIPSTLAFSLGGTFQAMDFAHSEKIGPAYPCWLTSFFLLWVATAHQWYQFRPAGSAKVPPQ